MKTWKGYIAVGMSGCGFVRWTGQVRNLNILCNNTMRRIREARPETVGPDVGPLCMRIGGVPVRIIVDKTLPPDTYRIGPYR